MTPTCGEAQVFSLLSVRSAVTGFRARVKFILRLLFHHISFRPLTTQAHNFKRHSQNRYLFETGAAFHWVNIQCAEQEYVEYYMKNRKPANCFFTLVVIICWGMNLALGFGSEKKGKEKILATGKILPQFQLNAPGSLDEQKYLGLKDSEPFYWSQISAQIIIMEIFSLYCPHCREQAPVLTRIYKFIQEDPALKDGIKMIGVAAGGDQEKTGRWKTTLRVPFPLFPDPETTLWQKLGKPGVPCTFIFTKSGIIMAIHYGATENTEDFFREIKKIYEEQK